MWHYDDIIEIEYEYKGQSIHLITLKIDDNCLGFKLYEEYFKNTKIQERDLEKMEKIYYYSPVQLKKLLENFRASINHCLNFDYNVFKTFVIKHECYEYVISFYTESGLIKIDAKEVGEEDAHFQFGCNDKFFGAYLFNNCKDKAPSLVIPSWGGKDKVDTFKKKLTSTEFADYIFNQYNCLVYNSEATKIDYNMWRQFCKWSSDKEETIIIGYTGLYFYLCNAKNDCKQFIIAKETEPDFFNFLMDIFFNSEAIEKYKNGKVLSVIEQGGTCGLAANVFDNLTIPSDYHSNVITTNTTIPPLFEMGSWCGTLKENIAEKITPEISSLRETIESIVDEVLKNNNNNNNNKGEEKKMKGFNFDFGPVGSGVHLSPYGMAIKNKSGSYVSYDPKSMSMIDVDIFNFEGASKFIYKIPVPIKDIAVGDVIVHNNVPMFVESVNEDGSIIAVDPVMGERKNILPLKNMFNFNFATKVVNLFGDMTSGMGASEDNPFGNMLPLMLLSDNKADMSELLPLMLLTNGNTGSSINPLMLMMAFDKGKDMNEMLPLLMLSGQFKM